MHGTRTIGIILFAILFLVIVVMQIEMFVPNGMSGLTEGIRCLNCATEEQLGVEEACLQEENSIEECKICSEKIAALRCICSAEGDYKLIYQPYLLYESSMVKCIGELALRKADKSFCFDKQIMQEVKVRSRELMGQNPSNIISDSWRPISEACFFYFISKSSADFVKEEDCEYITDFERKEECLLLMRKTTR